MNLNTRGNFLWCCFIGEVFSIDFKYFISWKKPSIVFNLYQTTNWISLDWYNHSSNHRIKICIRMNFKLIFAPFIQMIDGSMQVRRNCWEINTMKINFFSSLFLNNMQDSNNFNMVLIDYDLKIQNENLWILKAAVCVF